MRIVQKQNTGKILKKDVISKQTRICAAGWAKHSMGFFPGKKSSTHSFAKKDFPRMQPTNENYLFFSDSLVCALQTSKNCSTLTFFPSTLFFPIHLFDCLLFLEETCPKKNIFILSSITTWLSKQKRFRSLARSYFLLYTRLVFSNNFRYILIPFHLKSAMVVDRFGSKSPGQLPTLISRDETVFLSSKDETYW